MHSVAFGISRHDLCTRVWYHDYSNSMGYVCSIARIYTSISSTEMNPSLIGKAKQSAV